MYMFIQYYLGMTTSTKTLNLASRDGKRQVLQGLMQQARQVIKQKRQLLLLQRALPHGHAHPGCWISFLKGWQRSRFPDLQISDT